MNQISNELKFNPDALFGHRVEKQMQSNFESVLVQVASEFIKFKQLKIDLLRLANDFETDSKVTLKTELEQRTETQVKYKDIEIGSIETVLKIGSENGIYSVIFTPSKNLL